MKSHSLIDKLKLGGTMRKQIISFIDDLNANKKLATFDEASTKQAVVLRLLSFLDWDIFNVAEVYPDFSIKSSTVSYALRIRNSSKVFIEVKRVHKKLDSYQKELVNLAARGGVELAILTNGITWWFYRASDSGKRKQQRFYSVDLLKHKPEKFVPDLIDLLSKNKVAKGESMSAAKTLFQKKQQKLAADVLPEAWNRVLTQPNKILVGLLSEQAEKLCGAMLNAETIEKFIKKYKDRWLIETNVSSAAAPYAAARVSDILDLSEERRIENLPNGKTIMLDEPIFSTDTSPYDTDTSLYGTDTSLSGTDKLMLSTDTIKLAKSYMEKSITAFSFNGNRFKVQTWVEMLTTLSDYLASINSKNFEKVLWISNDQKARFSRYSEQLRMPEEVKGTDIYVETKMNPEEVIRTCCQLIAEFGYCTDDLQIEAA